MNFCFVYNNLLSASSQPGKNKRTSYYLDLYKENQIKVLVSLYKKIILPKEYENEFQIYFYPISEIEYPSMEIIDEIVDLIIRHIKKKEPVNVNCAAGISTSAMILSATLMKLLETNCDDAMNIISKNRYALEEFEKIFILREYGKYLAKSAGIPHTKKQLRSDSKTTGNKSIRKKTQSRNKPKAKLNKKIQKKNQSKKNINK